MKDFFFSGLWVLRKDEKRLVQIQGTHRAVNDRSIGSVKRKTTTTKKAVSVLFTLGKIV